MRFYRSSYRRRFPSSPRTPTEVVSETPGWKTEDTEYKALGHRSTSTPGTPRNTVSAAVDVTQYRRETKEKPRETHGPGTYVRRHKDGTLHRVGTPLRSCLYVSPSPCLPWLPSTVRWTSRGEHPPQLQWRPVLWTTGRGLSVSCPTYGTYIKDTVGPGTRVTPDTHAGSRGGSASVGDRTSSPRPHD